MPRPGPPRPLRRYRATDAEYAPVEDLAARDHGGNVSAALRRIIAEWDALVNRRKAS